MKPILSRIAVVSTLSVAFFISSCGKKKDTAGASKQDAAETVKKDTADSLTDEVLVQFDALIVALGSAKDIESAGKSAKAIDAIGDKMVVIAKRLEALDEPSEELKKAIDAKMEKAMDAKKASLNEAMKGAMANPEVMKVLGESMKGFGQKMKAADETFKKYGKK